MHTATACVLQVAVTSKPSLLVIAIDPLQVREESIGKRIGSRNARLDSGAREAGLNDRSIANIEVHTKKPNETLRAFARTGQNQQLFKRMAR